ncbi:hypothetical protein BKA82DRAFT_4201621 [Pisolithus tinctorius]|nr:hypothetical protein BKA82DRAFT_4201621 [Pisolithus tinctorius]
MSTTRLSSSRIIPGHRPHTLPPITPPPSQVGGHAGVQTTEDGPLLLKPALPPRELASCQLVRNGVSLDMDATTVAK